MQVIGSLLFGDAALRGIHVGAVIGVAVGVASQLVDVNLLLPPIMRALHGHDIWAAEVPAFWSWAAHVVYGLALGLLFTSVRGRRG